MNIRILWAVDFTAAKDPQIKTYRTLKALLKGTPAAIEPVNVLSPDQLRVPTKAFAQGSKQYSLEAEQVLKKWTQGLKDPLVSEPTLLVSDHYSRRSSVNVLLEYAKTTGAALIAMNTHAKSGVVRWLLGSFVETLLLYSTTPLLVVNPKAKATTHIKNILFPTDLSPASRQALNRIVPIAKTLKAKLSLYHKVEYVLPETALMVGAAPTYAQYLEEDVEQRGKKMDSWVSDLKKEGVQPVSIFDRKPKYVVDSILAEAKKQKSDLIALTSHSKPFTTLVLGSIARDVIRKSTHPVWVVHSGA